MEETVEETVGATNQQLMFWDILYAYQQKGVLCDMHLCVKDHEGTSVALGVHRTVLVASSYLFHTCLERNDLLESYDLDGISIDNLKLLIEYIYRQISWKQLRQVQEAALAADTLQIMRYDQENSSQSVNEKENNPKVVLLKISDKDYRVEKIDSPGEEKQKKVKPKCTRNAYSQTMPVVSENLETQKNVNRFHSGSHSQGHSKEGPIVKVGLQSKRAVRHRATFKQAKSMKRQKVDDTKQSDSVDSVTSNMEVNRQVPDASETANSDQRRQDDIFEAVELKPKTAQDEDDSPNTGIRKSRRQTSNKAWQSLITSKRGNYTRPKSFRDETTNVKGNERTNLGTDTSKGSASGGLSDNLPANEGEADHEAGGQSESMQNRESDNMDSNENAKINNIKEEQNAEFHELSCTLCGKDYPSMTLVLKHERNIHGHERIFNCQKCGETFKRLMEYKQHDRAVHQKSFSCEECSLNFKTKEGLKIHDKKNHNAAPPHIKCDECGKEFYDRSNLRSHKMFQHSDLRPFECDQCDRAFKNRNMLNRHRNTFHSNIRKFQCDLCGRLFKTRNDAKRHRMTHDKDATKGAKFPDGHVYACEYCGKEFKKRSLQMSHQNLQHKQKSEGAQYICTLCNKTFPIKHYLMQHVKFKHFPKKFQCQECYKEFNVTGDLKRHMESGRCRGEPLNKPYSCPSCGKTFTLKGNLNKHQQNVCKGPNQTVGDYIIVFKQEGNKGAADTSLKANSTAVSEILQDDSVQNTEDMIAIQEEQSEVTLLKGESSLRETTEEEVQEIVQYIEMPASQGEEAGTIQETLPQISIGPNNQKIVFKVDAESGRVICETAIDEETVASESLEQDTQEQHETYAIVQEGNVEQYVIDPQQVVLQGNATSVVEQLSTGEIAVVEQPKDAQETMQNVTTFIEEQAVGEGEVAYIIESGV